MAVRLEPLAPPSGRTVSHSMRFETNRHDTTSCTGLTVTTDHLCVYCISPCRQDGPSVIYALQCPAATYRHDGSSFRIVYLSPLPLIPFPSTQPIITPRPPLPHPPTCTPFP